jgi:hypothetical protein
MDKKEVKLQDFMKVFGVWSQEDFKKAEKTGITTANNKSFARAVKYWNHGNGHHPEDLEGIVEDIKEMIMKMLGYNVDPFSF